MPDEQAIQELRSTLRGQVIGPSDHGYDEARQLYNKMIDKRPAVIARCADVADVVCAVNLGREHELLIAIRGGGHNGGGTGSWDGGPVMDLSQMKGVRGEPEAQTGRGTCRERGWQSG